MNIELSCYVLRNKPMINSAYFHAATQSSESWQDSPAVLITISITCQHTMKFYDECQRKVEMSSFLPDRNVRFWLIDFRQG